MARKLYRQAALALAASAAVALGACKANDTAGTAATAAADVPVPGTAGKAPAAPAAPATGTTAVHADGVRRVNVAELQKMLEGGNVAIYDTRAKANYDQEHIKGALSMPQGEVASRAGEFPRDKTLVFYCT